MSGETNQGRSAIAQDHGQVSKMSHSEKGKVENKVDQVFMLNTTSQEEGAAPYALQAAKLDFKSLRRDVKDAVQKGLPERPTAGGLACQ